MKRIQKLPEPQGFSDWKADDRMRHRPSWNRLPGNIRRLIHVSLMEEQGRICCYCERRIFIENSHIEHFRPKSRREFEFLQLDYDNLHCSCQREIKQGEPRHCATSKGSWFDEGLIISPLSPDCEDRFRFIANGDIFPRDPADAAATATIGRLRLDLDKLRAMRASAVDSLSDLSKPEIETLLADRTGGQFLPFYTTIKQVLS